MKKNQNNPPQLGNLHHVTIDVTDLQTALEFYINILGLEELPTPQTIKEKGIRWLELGEGKALHLVENRDALPSGNAHFAITVDDVDGWRKYLKENGVEILSPKYKLYNADRFFLKDPSGNRFELVKWLE